MKIILVLALSLGLTGCGSMNFWVESGSAEDQPAPSQSAAESPVPPPNGAADETAPASAQEAPAEEASASPPAPVTHAAATPSVHCKALARQRAIDAAYEGEDGDTQEAVYNRTYSDCVAWDLKHAFR